MRALAGVAVLVALGVWVGTDAVLDGLAAIDAPAVLAALVVGLLTTVCSAWRWRLVAGSLGVPLALPVAVADTYRALFLNSVLPAGVLGDVHRAVRHGPGWRAVVVERVAGQVIVVVVGAGVVLTHPALRPGPWTVAAGLAVLAALAVVAARSARVRSVLGAVRGVWPGVLAASVLGLAGYLALFVVAARAAGAQAPLGELLPLLVLALLAMALPLNVGGWGPREAAGTVAFGAAGLGATQGLTTAVVYGVLSMIACLPGLVVLMLDRTVRVRAPEPVPC